MKKDYQEILKQKPKKPLNPYFQFRCDKLKECKALEEYRDHASISMLVKKDWDELGDIKREEMNAQFQRSMLKYQADMAVWKKTYNITEHDEYRVQQLAKSRPNPPPRPNDSMPTDVHIERLRTVGHTFMRKIAQEVKKDLADFHKSRIEGKSQAHKQLYVSLCRKLKNDINYIINNACGGMNSSQS